MNIKKLLKQHQDIVLTVIALTMAVMVAYLFIWGVTFLATDIGTAVVSPSGVGAVSGFNLDGAAKLDFQGVSP